jgi:hypothetical protein
MNFEFLPMKTVNYQRGLVSFDIPAHWREDTDPAGSARFYDDSDDTGTMRLNVLSFGRKTSQTIEDTARDVFRDQPYEMLPGKLPMRHALTMEDEGGESLQVHRWDVLVAVSPQQWRLVCFGYTGLASAEGEARTQEEFRIVDHAVRTARYASATQN